jgi:hypothetical protein
MAAIHQIEDYPPSYMDSKVKQDADELLQPMILILSERAIYSAESPAVSPLYELTPALHTLMGMGESVLLERCQYVVRKSSNNIPKVVARRKHIFNLAHPAAITMPLFSYKLDQVSRSSAGSLALKRISIGRKGFKVVKIASPGQESFFEVRRQDSQWVWYGADGSLIAFEDGLDGQDRLLVTRSLTRQVFDALVGAWCLRLWHDSVESSRHSADGKTAAFRHLAIAYPTKLLAYFIQRKRFKENVSN